jgi:hypothetical protein
MEIGPARLHSPARLQSAANPAAIDVTRLVASLLTAGREASQPPFQIYIRRSETLTR